MKKILLKIYYLLLKIKKFLIIMYNKLFSLLVKSPYIHDTDMTINKIITSRCSASRYGDGEFSLMQGKDLLFQPFSINLQKRLNEIIKSDRKEHIVCIPYTTKSTEWCTDNAKEYWEKYFNLNRSKIYKILNFNKEYFDSLVTRLYIDHQDKSKATVRFVNIKELWKDREVIVIEGTKSRLGVGNDLFDNVRKLNRIICPAINAFSKYELILDEAKKQDRNTLFLLALGPTATVLAYDLSELGYQAVDIGHIDIEYEWFLSNATEKTPIEQKYIGEIEGGTNVQEIEDKQYEIEIISNII